MHLSSNSENIWPFVIVHFNSLHCAQLCPELSCSADEPRHTQLSPEAVTYPSAKCHLEDKAGPPPAPCCPWGTTPGTEQGKQSQDTDLHQLPNSFDTSSNCEECSCSNRISIGIEKGRRGISPSSSFFLSSSISFWNWRSKASLGSSLILALFFMFLARFAYLRVLIVSS